MRPILRVERALVHQSHIGFMDQGRALQRVFGAFSPQMVPRDVPEFSVNERDQLLKRPLVAGFPADQKLRDRLGRLLRHKKLGRKHASVKTSCGPMCSQCLQGESARP